LGAASDERIAAQALQSNAAILTRDLDFADIRRYPPDQYHGIVVLRLPDTAIAQEIVGVLERFLKDPGFVAALKGRLAIVDVERVRFRPPVLISVS
jgi:predicted nuclease of predicted toxin-antitoxin system